MLSSRCFEKFYQVAGAETFIGNQVHFLDCCQEERGVCIHLHGKRCDSVDERSKEGEKNKNGLKFFFFILNKKKEPEKKPVVATTTTTTTTTYVEHYDYSYVPVASYVSSGAVSSKKSEAENRASEKSSSYAAPESRASEKSSSHSARDQAQLQASYSSSHDDEEEGSSSYARRSGLKEKLCFPSSSFLLQ